MLRSVVLAFAVCILVVSALAAAVGATGAWVPVIWGAILLASLVFERFRYKPLVRGVPGPSWERTSERFVDDETGKLVTVYIEKATGERRYVEE